MKCCSGAGVVGVEWGEVGSGRARATAAACIKSANHRWGLGGLERGCVSVKSSSSKRHSAVLLAFPEQRAPTEELIRAPSSRKSRRHVASTRLKRGPPPAAAAQARGCGHAAGPRQAGRGSRQARGPGTRAGVACGAVPPTKVTGSRAELCGPGTFFTHKPRARRTRQIVRAGGGTSQQHGGRHDRGEARWGTVLASQPFGERDTQQDATGRDPGSRRAGQFGRGGSAPWDGRGVAGCLGAGPGCRA